LLVWTLGGCEWRLHAPTDLSLSKEPPLLTGKETGCTVGLVALGKSKISGCDENRIQIIRPNHHLVYLLEILARTDLLNAYDCYCVWKHDLYWARQLSVARSPASTEEFTPYNSRWFTRLVTF